MLPSAPRGQDLRTKAAPGPPTVVVSVHSAWCHSSGMYPLPYNHSCDPTPHKWTGMHAGLLSLWNSTPLWPWPYWAVGFLCLPSFRFLGTSHDSLGSPSRAYRLWLLFSRSCLPSCTVSALPPPHPTSCSVCRWIPNQVGYSCSPPEKCELGAAGREYPSELAA